MKVRSAVSGMTEKERIAALNGQPPRPATAEPQDAEPFITPEHWKLLDPAELHDWKCEPLEPLVDRMIARGNFAYIAAETQTGKSLFGVYEARKLIQGGDLFGKYKISPVEKLLYLVLEDPGRRVQERLLDTEHEFTEAVEKEKCIFHVAPGFRLDDDKMLQWLEAVIEKEGRKVVFLDTYQKATPGIGSFNDVKQRVLLHKLGI